MSDKTLYRTVCFCANAPAGPTWQSAGATVWVPYGLSLIAEASGHAGQPEAGVEVITEALALIDSTHERHWEAELHRLKGTLLLQSSMVNREQAATHYHQALDVARHQQAKSLELRAVMSLCRLWQQQGKRQEAYDLLAPVYHWFTEGFDTADLQDAQALLEALQAPRSASARGSS